MGRRQARRGWMALVGAAALLIGLSSVASADLIVPGQPYRPHHRRPDPPRPVPIRPAPAKPPAKPAPIRRERPMRLVSPVFKPGATVPQVHTCEGANTSPPLSFVDVPASAVTLALIVDDPDAPDPKAPKQTWVHWVLWNLPPAARGLEDDANAKGLPDGTSVGRNDWDHAAWGGPCPPIGRHRYMFKLYALDTRLPPSTPKPWTKAELERAIEGHILASAQLVGTYQKVANEPPAGRPPGAKKGAQRGADRTTQGRASRGAAAREPGRGPSP